MVEQCVVSNRRHELSFAFLSFLVLASGHVPRVTVMGSLNSLSALRNHYQLPQAVWDALEKQLGDVADEIRNLAAAPANIFTTSVETLQLADECQESAGANSDQASDSSRAAMTPVPALPRRRAFITARPLWTASSDKCSEPSKRTMLHCGLLVWMLCFARVNWSRKSWMRLRRVSLSPRVSSSCLRRTSRSAMLCCSRVWHPHRLAKKCWDICWGLERLEHLC